MQSLEQQGLDVGLVIGDSGEVVESDHVVGPQPQGLLVTGGRSLLDLLVPQVVAVVIPHLGIVRGAGQTRPRVRIVHLSHILLNTLILT